MPRIEFNAYRLEGMIEVSLNFSVHWRNDGDKKVVFGADLIFWTFWVNFIWKEFKRVYDDLTPKERILRALNA